MSVETNMLAVATLTSPDQINSPEYVTRCVEAEHCPGCNAGEMLIDKERSTCVCQVCGLQCRRLTTNLWCAETPPPPRPQLPLRAWFEQAVQSYGGRVTNRLWPGALRGGAWVSQWRAGWAPLRALIWHDAAGKVLRGAMPWGLANGAYVADALWVDWVPPMKEKS